MNRRRGPPRRSIRVLIDARAHLLADRWRACGHANDDERCCCGFDHKVSPVKTGCRTPGRVAPAYKPQRWLRTHQSRSWASVLIGSCSQRRRNSLTGTPDERPRAARPRLNQPTRTSAPPSTGSATPVMKLASSEARNSAAFATSHAVPIRPRSGTLASRSANPSP
jgi:hypothetical protein